jgi:hypothetical protein
MKPPGGEMKKVFGFLLLLAPLASAQTCKANEYDMLEWMAPSQPVMNSHYNVIYPATGRFYWVKGSLGYPWDVNDFDTKGIYDSTTELTWSNPSSFKVFEKPRQWVPRCVPIPASSGKLAVVTQTPDETWYDMHTSCTSFTRHNLQYSVTELWGPDQTAVAPLPTAPTLTLAYRHGCDASYAKCSEKETFELQHGPGLVRWTHYVWNTNAWKQVQQTIDNLPISTSTSTVVPVHPCWD